jgi:hypothetical protein
VDFGELYDAFTPADFILVDANGDGFVCLTIRMHYNIAVPLLLLFLTQSKISTYSDRCFSNV